ncbi:chitin synthase [Fadolivirus algeromassiliense]|jgi:cellulose synthase/poly-beta-1,6-N-acetylglucosamine synthase-like glycosyltransferase|uniref:chitin synthase n=1 Tax=Fadolivirus FV1/VV64 TaxID=3070911 RepID=A0A7D3QUG9_9VIRU|nr:chitin synthase [Fadolivirus algeromassiliense]QKF93524.1 chitin synthase [Fadolivirus FV1/VV64]
MDNDKKIRKWKSWDGTRKNDSMHQNLDYQNHFNEIFLKVKDSSATSSNTSGNTSIDKNLEEYGIDVNNHLKMNQNNENINGSSTEKIIVDNNHNNLPIPMIKINSIPQIESIELIESVNIRQSNELKHKDRVNDDNESIASRSSKRSQGGDSIYIDDVSNVSTASTTRKRDALNTIKRQISREFMLNYTADELATLQKKKIEKQGDDGIYESDPIGDSYYGKDTPTQYEIEKGITISKFHDYRPKSKKYFKRPPGITETSEKDGIAVVIPFFNEPSHELQQTLNSLNKTFIELKRMSKKWRDKKLYVCLIQDGWHKADKSMKAYLQYMFPKKIGDVGWWEHFPEFRSDFKDNECNATFIFERRNYMPSVVNLQDDLKDDRNYMKITLVIKINNRRKHNSHEWFLAKNGFAETVNAKYLFLTDAFTLYSEKCLYYLVKELDKNHKLSAVTGRQRLMTRDQQGSGESIFSFGYVLRMMQLYDFELANAVYNGAFHLGGLLPVIPGPCGLYRASDLLQNNVRDSYFKVVNEEPSKTGLVLGNLRIAEDRVLSYYSVIKTEERKSMAFNPLAVFYFEAETDLQKFILQRRRWINGSVAGYIYLLFQNFSDFRQWDAPFYRKVYVWILLMCQFLIYCMVSVVPGIMLKTLYYGLAYFFGYYGIKSDIGLISTFIVIWALYICHVFIHHKTKFNYIIMYLLVFLSLVTSLVSFGSLFHYAFIDTDQTVSDIMTSGNPIIYMGIAVFFLPFILALCLSGRGHSFMYMIKSFIQYTLFIPLLIGWFGSYAYARTWDLTWGNRPANELNDITEEQKKIMITKFKEKNIRIIMVLIALNIAIFFIPLQGQFVLMGLFFAIALYQMFFSFVFCLSKVLYKAKMCYKGLTKDKSYNPLDSEV